MGRGKELTLGERIAILNVLPRQHNYATLRVIRDLENALSLSEAEHKEFDIHVDGDRMTWNEKGKEPRFVEIGERGAEIIRDALVEKNTQNALTAATFSVYEKFVLQKEVTG